MGRFMHFTVVRKMVIGFTSLALLLIITSVLSYVGLTQIKDSAEQVAREKMPIQRVVTNLNVDILRLGTITTNAYFESQQSALEQLKAKFDEGFASYAEELADLGELVSEQNTELLQKINANSDAYLSASNAMF